MTSLRRLGPFSLRGRLIFAFTGVVIFALALVVVALPNLLDGYFLQQEQKNLDIRAVAVQALLEFQLESSLGLGTDDPQAIVQATQPATIAPGVAKAMGQPTDPQSLISSVTTLVAQANLDLSISTDPAHPEQVLYRVTVAYAPDVPTPGQERDSISQTSAFTIADPWWSQFPGTVPMRLVTLRLSSPYDFRADTLRSVLGVLLTAAAVALLVALLASILLADRLTNPIRRLTRASRALGEGDLASRVSVEAGGGSPEIGELATTFNRMADRLTESIDLIRRDRDRSRDFLADVSHELRTPIAALRTFNELLQEGAAEDPLARRRVPAGERPADRAPGLAGDQPAGAVQARLGARGAGPATRRSARRRRKRRPAGGAGGAAQGRGPRHAAARPSRCASGTTRRASARC